MRRTEGSPDIRVGLIDGPVNLTHPDLVSSRLLALDHDVLDRQRRPSDYDSEKRKDQYERQQTQRSSAGGAGRSSRTSPTRDHRDRSDVRPGVPMAGCATPGTEESTAASVTTTLVEGPFAVTRPPGRTLLESDSTPNGEARGYAAAPSASRTTAVSSVTGAFNELVTRHACGRRSPSSWWRSRTRIRWRSCSPTLDTGHRASSRSDTSHAWRSRRGAPLRARQLSLHGRTERHLRRSHHDEPNVEHIRVPNIMLPGPCSLTEVRPSIAA